MLFVSSLPLTLSKRRGDDRTHRERKTPLELPLATCQSHSEPRSPPTSAWFQMRGRWVGVTGSFWARFRQSKGRRSLNLFLRCDTHKEPSENRPTRAPTFMQQYQCSMHKVLRKSIFWSADVTTTRLKREVSKPPTLSPRPLMEALEAASKLSVRYKKNISELGSDFDVVLEFYHIWTNQWRKLHLCRTSGLHEGNVISSIH